jgi:hypothetical protein
MVSNCCLGDRAYVALTRLKHVWVVGRKNSGSGAYNRAEGIVHLLGLGLLDSVLESGT